MADIRIKDLATTASTTASDDFMAVDGTTNGTRKLSAATPSFATSVTVPGVVGPTSTDLTLTGGSTGASLVLGATTSGVATLTGLGGITLATPVGAATTIQRTGLNGVGAAGVLSITTDAKTANDAIQLGFTALDSANNAQTYSVIRTVITDPTSTSEDADLVFLSARAGTITEAARLVSTGNLLIGTTTDAASLAGGLVVNGSGAGAAASSTTTGALRVTGGVGVSGAIYAGAASVFGSTVNSLGYVLNRTNNSGHYTGTSDNYGFTWTGTNGEMSTATGSMIFKPANTTALTLTSTAATFAGAVTIGGNLTLPAAAAATTRYILSAANNDGTIVFQNGVGSSAAGGSLQLNGSTHATRPGWVTVGLGSGSTRKFTVSDSGTPGGTDVFTVDATGAAAFAGAVSIGNTVAAAVAVASTHKVTMVIGGVTYYLLASNV